MPPSFPTFFETATGHPPYPWQGRLANGDGYRTDDPTTHNGTPCTSHLIDIPTVLGPFRLAYLETLIRAADGRGSAQ